MELKPIGHQFTSGKVKYTHLGGGMYYGDDPDCGIGIKDDLELISGGKSTVENAKEENMKDLDKEVAVAIGWHKTKNPFYVLREYGHLFSPSTDGMQMVKLQIRYKIGVFPTQYMSNRDQQWGATRPGFPVYYMEPYQFGETPGVALCKSIIEDAKEKT